MKRIGLFIIVALLCSNTLFAQSKPDWMDDDVRAKQYPSSKFLVGFAFGDLIAGEDVAHATERVKNSAQGNLLESIRVNMETATSLQMSSESVNGQYSEYEKFASSSSKNAFAEIVGMKSDSYYDKKTKTVYVFVFANRKELIDYHQNLLQYNLSQVEGLLSTATKLSDQNDKASARSKCGEAMQLLQKIDESQTILITLTDNASMVNVQQSRAKSLSKSAFELQAKLDPKYEILENLKNALSRKLLQAESILSTCKNLIADGEKSKARQQCEMAQTMIPDIRNTQDSMRAVDPLVSLDMLEQNRTESLYNEVKVLSAQLAQAVVVYVNSSENMFGKSVGIISGKLKSQLASLGCSFTDDITKADFKLELNAEARESSSDNNFVFCYADVTVDLYDIHKQKSVYSDEISEKGGSTTKEKAVRKAMENAAGKILKEITPWVK